MSCLKRISASGSVLSFFHTTTCFITWHRMLGLGLGLGVGARARARANPNLAEDVPRVALLGRSREI